MALRRQTQKMMKFSFAVLLMAFSAVKVLCGQPVPESKKMASRPLWIVDGVELRDFDNDYTIEQMRSDSAAILAAISLKCIHRLSDLKSIEVLDSTEASLRGYYGCTGVIDICTNIHQKILFIVNGLLHFSRETLSGGACLVDANIERVINSELSSLEKYGIKDVEIIKEVAPMIYGNGPRCPIVIVKTEYPYYAVENLTGKFKGRVGQRNYNLLLNPDSFYVFLQYNKRIKSESSGVWVIDKDMIYLLHENDDEFSVEESSKSDTMRIGIKSNKELLFHKEMWNNRKAVKLKKIRRL